MVIAEHPPDAQKMSDGYSTYLIMFMKNRFFQHGILKKEVRFL